MTKNTTIAWLAFLAVALMLGSCSWPRAARGNPSIGLPQADPTPTPTELPLPQPSPSPWPSPTPTISPQALAARLGFTMPVKGAHVPEWLDLVPGAPREYRSGVHEGVDFGFDAVGVTVQAGTPVLAAGDGIVVRADVDYREPSPKEMEEILARSRALGNTTDVDLDKLRGRQVWIDHGEGVKTRYAHLDGLAPGIVPGVRVSRGQLIAYVGSSGIPGEGASPGPHLHLEIRLGEGYLGQGLSPERARQLYVQALAGRD